MIKMEIRLGDNLEEMVSKASIEKMKRDDLLAQAEVRELTERFKAMSLEEMALFVDIVPVELCLNRIQKELKRAEEFKEMIERAVKGSAD